MGSDVLDNMLDWSRDILDDMLDGCWDILVDMLGQGAVLY